MMTLMPVAAFAGTVGVAEAPEADMSYFVADGDDQTVTLKKAKEGLVFNAVLQDADEDATTGTIYVWAKDANGTVSSALSILDNAGTQTDVDIDGVWKIADANNNTDYKLAFSRAGEYTVYAGLVKKGVTDVDSLSKINVFGDPSKIKVTGSSANPDDYLATIDGDTTLTNEEDQLPADSDKKLGKITLVPNNVESNKYTVSFEEVTEWKDITDSEGKVTGKEPKTVRDLRNKTVTISTNSSSIEVNKETATTNSRGEIDFKVSASVEGTYEIELEIDGVSWTVEVQVGNTSATYIELGNQPKAPQAQYAGLGHKIRFAISDINGNIVKPANGETVATNEEIAGMEKTLKNVDGKYIVLTEKPSASNLESEELGLAFDADKQQWYLTGITTLDAEGTYEVKVILDNGAYATATWEVKKFQKPVKLRIDYPTTTVELGGKISPDQVVYVDANDVEKNATDADFAATGYAVQNLKDRTITVKTDEKYVGAKINVTAVSEKYDLVATAELTVAEGASEIAFADKTAEVNVNNKIVWNVVDSNGNKVALGSEVVKADVSYVVLDKPEGAKVSTNDVTVVSDLKSKGEGKLALTSNKVGNVAVQVILKAEYKVADDTEKVQVKYYTGTQIFAVGNGSVGDVVVMSIGSNEIIVNDAKATIDAAPMVQNDRTYVPFRALAEAFGAEVAYDEATQAVTAELNGVTVVMTIGSATYTVNGEEKTMDVAPFINGSRTMVPVRFAAEAFGIKVIPTYDENGATADILFNL